MNGDYKELLLYAKLNIGDNNERDASMIPCAVSYKWDMDDVDNVPEDFNWKQFWIDCKRMFPYHSVSGGKYFDNETKIKGVELNKCPILLAEDYKYKKVLEIGYGYGGAARHFNTLGFQYYGIDFVSSGTPDDYYGTFIEIDKSGIPEELQKQNGTFSVVYSENVFQHLTKQQRIEYYEQAYNILEKGNGTFIFSLFTRNKEGIKEFYSKEENKHVPYATSFFGVHTSVPKEEDVLLALIKCGFDYVDIKETIQTQDIRTNYTTFIAKKEK